jgi:hypothetical protein
MCEKLKDLIPRQQFDIAIQAAIGAKILHAKRLRLFARRYGKMLRSDITLSGNSLKSRRRGNAACADWQFGVPQSSFMAVLKLDVLFARNISFIATLTFVNTSKKSVARICKSHGHAESCAKTF